MSKIITIKFLNGDLLELSCDNLNINRSTYIVNEICKYKEIKNRRLVKICNSEDDEDMYYCIIDVRESVPDLIKEETYTHQPKYWLTSESFQNITNQSIIVYLLLTNRMPILSNPHPLVIEHVKEVYHTFEKNYYLSTNPSDEIVNLLLENQRLIDWKGFSENENDIAITFLLSNVNRIDLFSFSKNKNKRAIHYVMNVISNYTTEIDLNQFIDNIDWNCLFKNNIITSCVWDFLKKYQADRLILLPVNDDVSSLRLNDMTKEIALSEGCMFSKDKRLLDCFFKEVLKDPLKHQYLLLEIQTKNDSDDVVDWFFNHPQFISIDRFLENPNDKAVEYCIRQIRQSESILLHLKFCNNPNEKAIDFCADLFDTKFDFLIQYNHYSKYIYENAINNGLFKNKNGIRLLFCVWEINKKLKKYGNKGTLPCFSTIINMFGRDDSYHISFII